ncbi:MAG: 1,2-phenylacetyl-CoA epoxidase subunit PaaE [Chitinophagaceae bacterium]
MIHFHSLEVQKIQKETDDCVSITFHVPDELNDTFQFKQGQSLTVRTIMNGEELRRNYSICSSPFDNELKIAVKKATGGIFSTYANEELKAGDHIDVMPPVGKFYTELDALQKKNYVAFAAGSGITPILSIIKTTLLTEPQSSFTLVYGNRNKASIIFKEDLEALKDKFINRFRIYHILSREKTDADINYGRIDKSKCELLFSKLINLEKCDEFFLCGPEEMIFSVRDFLLENGVPKNKIHFELFTIPGQKQSVKIEKKETKDEGPKATINVKLDGILFEFDLSYNGQSILDAALSEGADLPYACKGGVCTTCRAKLVEGKVQMDVNWGLEQEEIDKGFILTCQSHPITEKLVVDFDVK